MVRLNSFSVCRNPAGSTARGIVGPGSTRVGVALLVNLLLSLFRSTRAVTPDDSTIRTKAATANRAIIRPDDGRAVVLRALSPARILELGSTISLRSSSDFRRSIQ